MKLSSDDLAMFFEPAHARLAERLRATATALEALERAGAADRAIVDALAKAGLFELVCTAPVESPGPAGAHGNAERGGVSIDTRAICLAREALGYVSARADSILAVQGLGVHPLLLAGSDAQRAELPAFARGERVAAFALTEPEAGSDVASIQTRAVACAEGYRLDGDKLFISNLGIADHATVLAREGDQLTAFWVAIATPGIAIEPQQAIAPHPIGALHLRGAIVPASARIGAVGQGMKLAMQTLDAFRVSVGAAAVGMARRAFDEALAFVTRRGFPKPRQE